MIRARLRRHRASLLIASGLVAGVLVVLGLGAGALRTTTALDPNNPDPNGAQALARVLDDEGVRVEVARSADELRALAPGAGTTILVTSTDLLGESTARHLLAARNDATLVLVEPGPGTIEALDLTVESAQVRVRSPRTAACEDPAYRDLTVEVDRALAYSGTGCWGDDRGALLVEPSPGLLLWGAADALRNDQVLTSDNAAVALRLLGQQDRLVWYVPSIEDLVADDGVSLATLLPAWLRPALWLVFLATLALLGWRVRRLGPLATEPLPVVVRAIETTRSRGRLYRRAGDRAHAAVALRRAARIRLADHLRSDSRDPATLIREVAEQVGRPGAEITALLGPDAAAPATDHDLIHLAGQLAELDREVRRP